MEASPWKRCSSNDHPLTPKAIDDRRFHDHRSRRKLKNRTNNTKPNKT